MLPSTVLSRPQQAVAVPGSVSTLPADLTGCSCCHSPLPLTLEAMCHGDLQPAPDGGQLSDARTAGAMGLLNRAHMCKETAAACQNQALRQEAAPRLVLRAILPARCGCRIARSRRPCRWDEMQERAAAIRKTSVLNCQAESAHGSDTAGGSIYDTVVTAEHRRYLGGDEQLLTRPLPTSRVISPLVASLPGSASTSQMAPDTNPRAERQGSPGALALFPVQRSSHGERIGMRDIWGQMRRSIDVTAR